jgi:hypothetical protein
MSMTPGDVGSKSVFPDGIQIDHISENTTNHGARVRGISDPTTYPPIAGDMGEINPNSVGTQRSGTNGYTYSVRSSTAFGSGSYNKVVSAVLNKGIYLVSASIASSSTASSAWFQGYMAIGGTQVSTTQQGNSYNAGQNCWLYFVVPVVITADSTEVACYGGMQSGTITNGGAEMWIHRIG